MLYKNVYLWVLLYVICGPLHADGLTYANDSEVLHFRFNTPIIHNQDIIHSEELINRTLVQSEHEACDTDCLPFCFLLTGECAGTTIGYPNLGAALGIASGLVHEFLQCMYD